ncbi:hypothetical protein [Gordonia sputi]|uniref:hypothetical protein n=1 Tax=Gordonia sputi TaxID=36823 RepID=UPI0022710784|nr:hypothetical protein [Gordonia sputi]
MKKFLLFALVTVVRLFLIGTSCSAIVNWTKDGAHEADLATSSSHLTEDDVTVAVKEYDDMRERLTNDANTSTSDDAYLQKAWQHGDLGAQYGMGDEVSVEVRDAIASLDERWSAKGDSAPSDYILLQSPSHAVSVRKALLAEGANPDDVETLLPVGASGTLSRFPWASAWGSADHRAQPAFALLPSGRQDRLARSISASGGKGQKVLAEWAQNIWAAWDDRVAAVEAAPEPTTAQVVAYERSCLRTITDSRYPNGSSSPTVARCSLATVWVTDRATAD